MSRSAVLLLIGLASCSQASSPLPAAMQLSRPPTSAAGDKLQAAPGAPGNAPNWTPGNKQGVGTAMGEHSRLWFTLQGGRISELYYPQLDQAAGRSLVLAVGDGQQSWLEGEELATTTTQLTPDALLYRQSSKHPQGRFLLQKTVLTDPARDVLLLDISFFSQNTQDAVYLIFTPALGNATGGDSARVADDALLVEDGALAAALCSSPPLEQLTVGYHSTSDGGTDLARHGRLRWRYDRAAAGHVVLAARLPRAARIVVALGFADSSARALAQARQSLAADVNEHRRHYIAGWRAYLSTLKDFGPTYRKPYWLAAMVLRALEDKTYAGASIASPSIPWGQAISAGGPGTGGYHLVWSRDLYHAATAFAAMGDRASALRALDYLLRVQQQPDGSVPQNSWLDGRPYWGSRQLDEVAYPLLLAWQLGRHDAATWREHLRQAADYLVTHGPATPQERWEEEAGLSPSTIAAEVAALVCAGELARVHGDEQRSRRYLQTADHWAANLERWLVTRSGSLDDRLHNQGYYLRINDDRDPDDGALLEINNGGGTHDEREVVDAGFLELVRLGIRPADDPDIRRSLAVVDATIRVKTPHGPAWYRYNHDGYGETAAGGSYQGAGLGRLWPLLGGERGEYALAAGQAATPYLEAMLGFAGDTGMIPEQVWDGRPPKGQRFPLGQGTGSATPLAWSMAQFIRLLAGISAKRIVEQPDLVARRYLSCAYPPCVQ